MIYIDGKLCNEVNIDQGINYGYGVFETIKVIKNKPVFLAEHLNRLCNSCRELDIGQIDTNSLKLNINKLISGCNPKGIKINIIKDTIHGYSELVSIRDYHYNDEDYIKGFKVKMANSFRNPFSRIIYHKTNNYLENILEFRKAKQLGFDETIFINTQGFLAEGAISNVFLVRDKSIYTPTIDCGILNGIIREKIIEIALENSIKCYETKIKYDELKEFDSMFICNSLMNIMGVTEIENYKFTSFNDEIAKSISDKLKLKERDFY